jgi:hypothetical protein
VAVNASAVSAPVAKDEMLLLRVATDTNVEVPVLLAVLGHAVSATIEGPGWAPIDLLNCMFSRNAEATDSIEDVARAVGNLGTSEEPTLQDP